LIGAAIILAGCLFLLVYPFAVYPVILRALPEKRVATGAPDDVLHSVTLLFCAYNEAGSLPDKIANLRDLKERYPSLEVLAFDDGSTDGTGALLAAATDILTVVTGPGRSGKAKGMKTLVARATGDILVFTDANVTLDKGALGRLLSYYSDPRIGGVLGSLLYHGADASASANVGGLYWRIEEKLKKLESRCGNVMGADGSIFSVRRSLYPDFPDNVLDDLTVSMSVVFSGMRLVKAEDVIAHESMVAVREEELRRKVRIAARSWITHRYLRPGLRAMSRLDRFKYASRKLVRWFGAVWMLGAGISAFALAASWGFEWLAGLFVACLAVAAWGMVRRRGVFASLFDIALAYFATLQGIMLAIAGRDFTTWAPAKSRA
jgi:cellulose synthase/poly-beta-1,6-N-acetylglucosamine synthase-like glycosyltransferase